MIAKLIGISREDSQISLDTESEEKKNIPKPLISNFSVGGVDYTNEKIFETPHPYPRGDFVIKETFYFSKAVAILARFDQRCHSDSSSCSISISSNDTSYWFNDNFGTSYRSSSKPHGPNPFLYMLGNRVTIEFRSTNQGGRRRKDLQGDETVDRYGFRIAVNAIYPENIPNLTENIMHSFDSKHRVSKSKSKELANWFTLLNSMVHGSSVMCQTMIKGTESDHTNKSIVAWNLLRGGIVPGALDEKNHNPLTEYLKEIKEERGVAYKVCQKIRELAPKNETAINPLLKKKFSEETLKRWTYMVNISMICLMYHSDIIEDAFDYTMGMDPDDPDLQK